MNLRSPVSDERWKSFLEDTDSPVRKYDPQIYEKIIEDQAAVCQKVFQKPLCIISGAAGTGKTTILKALIHSIEQAHGKGTSFQLLAPTGKAADRIRERTDKPALTIHSFLASRGWLNNNMTFKTDGGRIEDGISTIIIDESSMLDLELTAALFRSINWNRVQRLIFVGDPDQLPPIGKGKIFVDTLNWLSVQNPEAIGQLKENIRQKENELTGKGNTILKLASLYTRNNGGREDPDALMADAETILRSIQEGGDIDKDLQVIFWKNTDELEEQIAETFQADVRHIAKKHAGKDSRLDQLWREIISDKDGNKRADVHQIISPYRGDLFGTDNINSIIQNLLYGFYLERKGTLGGITYFDKVIQFVNRPKSYPYRYVYNRKTKSQENLEVFNGEIGYVFPHQSDMWALSKPGHITRFNVTFSRRPNHVVPFSSEGRVTENIELCICNICSQGTGK